MDYLRRAQDFCFTRGDEDWFRNLYTGYREYSDVRESVWRTLNYLYGTALADELEKSTT